MHPTDRAFSGVRLLMQDGSPLDCELSGLADRQTATLWSTDTASQIASISKQVVAVVTLLLADRGVLRLDDSVARWLLEAPTQWEKVTLQHLMSHTSGLQHWGVLPGFDPAAAITPDRRLQQVLAAPLQNEPGDMWRYSSPGYIVLGAAVERAAGRPYVDLARELVIDHLGLTSTTVGSPPESRIARGYRDGQPVPPWDLHSMPGTGDVWSTALDVARFITALHTGGLLPAPVQTILRDTSVPLGRGPDDAARVATKRYALGHFIGSVDGRDARLHPGDNPGYQALAAWLPATRTTVVLLSNDEADDVEGALLDAVARSDYKAERSTPGSVDS